jgi:hypothetical protein
VDKKYNLAFNKALGSFFSARKKRQLGDEIAKLYENAERDRFYNLKDRDNQSIRYKYSLSYQLAKKQFLKGKGELYKENKDRIVNAYRANKVKDYGHLTGTLNESMDVEAIKVKAPLFKKSGLITLKMTINDNSDAKYYADEIDAKMKFFGFAYSKARLPNKYRRQLENIRRKYL